MPQFAYRARDKNGYLRSGERFAPDADQLSSELINEGIYPIQINAIKKEHTIWNKLFGQLFRSKLSLSELSIFCRQMQLLHAANVPIIIALKQLSLNSRSKRLAPILKEVISRIEQGHSLATAMQHYSDIFSPMMTSMIQIGENTGHLSEAFAHVHTYLDFEANSIKQIKSAFRYPTFVIISIFVALLVLNLFVIPTFSRFYLSLNVTLPWQTQLLISMSNFFVYNGKYLLTAFIVLGAATFRYLQTPNGQLRWHRFQLRLPIIGGLIKRIILIRFSQSLSIILNAGVPINQGLSLVKKSITNAFIAKQITSMQEALERGVPFTQAIANITLFTPLEIQILSVGEQSGELCPALNYISHFHNQEIEFDLKRMNDVIGPVLLATVSGLILIMTLGVYLPIWNMINLVHS